MKTIGVILAGGSGKRVGGNIPKQFLKAAGKTILEHTLDQFEQHPLIDEITIITAPEEIERTSAIIHNGYYKKVNHISAGGAERYLSTLAALKIHAHKNCKILIHDAARPLVNKRIISDVVKALEQYRAVNVAIPVRDTIIETDGTHQYITGIPDRSNLLMVQTPQGFHCDILSQAYETALQDPSFNTTDDCSVVKKYLPQEPIGIVAGDSYNLKFTYMEDLPLLEFLLKTNK